MMTRDLQEISAQFRRDIVKMYYRAGWGHMAPALSCVDILTSLAFGGVADLRMTEAADRLVLSKGHGCATYYLILAELGYFPKEELNTFYQSGSRLVGLSSPSVPGVEIPTGALGHGICFATGTALADKRDRNGKTTYVLLGDGESQEGSVWEAAAFAAAKGLNNMTVIMDRNRLQASDWEEKILPMEPMADKWKSFGWRVIKSDGHDHKEIVNALVDAKNETEKPVIIIADTIKGKGIAMAESKPEWHSRAPKGDEWDAVCNDLGIGREELDRI